jgi:hypothetical protein
VRPTRSAPRQQGKRGQPRPACGERSPRACAAGEGVQVYQRTAALAVRAPHPDPLPASAGRGRSGAGMMVGGVSLLLAAIQPLQ